MTRQAFYSAAVKGLSPWGAKLNSKQMLAGMEGDPAGSGRG